MLQQRQIVVKGLGKQIDTQDPLRIKYTGTSFQSVVWMLISVIVTMYRTIVPSQMYQNSHCIMMITKLRSCI